MSTSDAGTLRAVKPVVTADEYNRVDKAYEGDLVVAMDHAGYAVALAAARHGAGYGSRVIVLAGPGNNGGDGYVAARYLKHRGCDVSVRALAQPRTPEASDALAKALDRGVPVRSLSTVEPADLVIDALFGGGVRGGLPETIIPWLEVSCPIIAVDYPTGLDPNTGLVEDAAFIATETVTFQTLKTGHVRGDGPDHCGRVTVVDIGLPSGEPCMFVAEEVDAPRPTRPRTAHKWSAGSVLVVGGSSGLVGAAVFAGMSALEFGAGSVAVASPRRDLITSLAPQLPSFDLDEVESRLDRFDVVVAGPGLASDDLVGAVPILRKAGRVLLDAGGLVPQALQAAKEGDAAVVVTPHRGEFQRLSGQGGGAYASRAFARREGITVLLKGNPTLITDGAYPTLVTSGGPELASIGTGDVLAGMIGALWARGLQPKEATISGAYWHGVAASDLLRAEGAVTAPRLARHIGRFAW